MRRTLCSVIACTTLALALAGSVLAEEREEQRGTALRDLPDAPKVGDRIPDFTVTDQNGKAVSFHEKRGDRKAYLLIIRSASW